MAAAGPLDDERRNALSKLSVDEFATCVERIRESGQGLGMDLSQWQRVVKALDEIMTLPVGERSAFLCNLQVNNGPTCQIIEELLASAASSENSWKFALTGQQIGVYQVGPLLGSGGMGIVYRAHDPRFPREVALKIMVSSRFSQADAARRFEQEARATSAVSHPNIVTIFDVGLHEGMPYLVTELLEGTPLRKLLSTGSLPAFKAVDYAVQIAKGLGAAHDRNIIHRDIKPENLFVTANDHVKILDFGLAKLAKPELIPHDTSQQTRIGTIMGTLGYMSPEQLRGEPVDARADVWSWGVVLYEMLAGQRPFKASSREEEQDAILQRNPHNPSKDRELNHVVMKALSKRPEQRYARMQDAIADLEGIQERELSGGERRITTSARKMTMGIVVASLLVFVGLSLVPVWHWKTSTATHLRSDAKTVSLAEARTMAFTRGFYEANLNPSGRGIPHQYQVRMLQDGAVVVDGSTGLMWQREGSPAWMDWQGAKDYVRSLNTRKLDGFDNWRLPTLEEAMSLMTPAEGGQQGALVYENEERKTVFHISPQFAITRAWTIWTADTDSSGRGWAVYLENASCRAQRITDNYYVRVVRSIRSSGTL